MTARPAHLAIFLLLLLSAGAATVRAQDAAQQSVKQPGQPAPAHTDAAQLPRQEKIPNERPCFALLFANQLGRERGDRMGANSVLAASYPVGDLPKPCGALTPVLAPVVKSVVAPVDWFARFVTGPEVKPFSPVDKAHLALRNLFDPFNALTILGQSGISVASDSHSPYGPGMAGFGRNVGVSFTEDMTGQFFDTFLIPSLVHQDPHYHRLPKATIARRILHTATQVVWTVGDNGEPMPNYANLIGGMIDDEIGNLYVPGRRTNLPSSAERYGVNLATAPVDNLITEFLPDIARHIHIKDVLIQSLINQVAKTGQ